MLQFTPDGKNHLKRAGYEVICVPLHDGKATGSYEHFLTGFVVDDNSVWGRPVGVAVGKDASLFVYRRRQPQRVAPDLRGCSA